MKIGILGGGQLGKMLYSPAAQLDLDIAFMDQMPDGPVAKVANDYTLGQINIKSDVMAFGASKDVISIEIEKVNTEALKELQRKGKKIYPQPDIIETIQDKGVQKQFYADRGLPTSRFAFCADKKDVTSHVTDQSWSFPFVQKLRKDGYDGRGVTVIKDHGDLLHCFEAPSIIEEMVSIQKEISVVTCRDEHGHIAVYDPVEMVFHPEANILLYQLAPADIPQDVLDRAMGLAKETSEAYGIVGLLAIEMFWTTDDQILINEVAPRPHNSGHHTIEVCHTSQYENHLRAISGLPLGSTTLMSPSLLMNVLGDQGYQGAVHYEGLDKVLAESGVQIHLYGKATTKPFRKMGHINIIGQNREDLIKKYEFIQRTLRVISKPEKYAT